MFAVTAQLDSELSGDGCARAFVFDRQRDDEVCFPACMSLIVPLRKANATMLWLLPRVRDSIRFDSSLASLWTQITFPLAASEN